MFKANSTMTAALLLASTMSYAASVGTNKVTIGIERIGPTHTHEMYRSYCAPCHGVDGRGNGPAAASLKTRPADLTVLARNHHGKYPETHVVTTLQFGDESRHSAMPGFGKIFRTIDLGRTMESQQRVSNLSSYLQTLQVK